LLSPFQNSGVGGVGVPCIESFEVAKRDAPFRLSLWSRVVVMWRRIREELACARPLSDFGDWESQGNSHVEYPTCEVPKCLLGRRVVTTHGRVRETCAWNLIAQTESQKELTPDTPSFHSREKGKVAYALKPALRNRKVLRLTIERDHPVLENCLASEFEILSLEKSEKLYSSSWVCYMLRTKY
jgi:hypothetical protein